MIGNRRLLSTHDLASLLKVTPETVRRWQASGVGPEAVNIGGSGSGARFRYEPEAVRRWLKSRSNGAEVETVS